MNSIECKHWPTLMSLVIFIKLLYISTATPFVFADIITQTTYEDFMEGESYNAIVVKTDDGAVQLAEGALTKWEKAVNDSVARSHLVVVLDKKLYVMDEDDPHTQFAIVKDDGGIGNWKPTTPLPSLLKLSGVVGYNGKIYVAGGRHILKEGQGYTDEKKVYVGTTDPDGNITEWAENTPLPKAMWHPLLFR